MLLIDHLRVIQNEFSSENDSKKILDNKLFQGWQLPTSQISYISDIIDAFDGDLGKAMARLESDNYMEELTPFMPGFKKTVQKKKEAKPNYKATQKKKENKKQVSTNSTTSSKEGILMAAETSSYLDRIKDYQLITAHTPSALNQEVKKEMELYGWIPYGGASVAHAGMGSSLGGAGSYFQAMVKLKKK
tara:strand:+ start:218 stop:784 length:567 start_codon:yes stop_codon:yes gene_type:complete